MVINSCEALDLVISHTFLSSCEGENVLFIYNDKLFYNIYGEKTK